MQRRALILTTLAAIGLLVSVLAPVAGAQQAGLGNPGFETGVIAPWEVGYAPQGVEVVGGDEVPDSLFGGSPLQIRPRYDGKMARLGKPEWGQPDGVNEVFQNFTIAEPTLKFSFNWCTYDGSGNDWVDYKVTVYGDTPTVVASYSARAPQDKSDYALWCSGWQDQAVEVAAHVGKQAQLYASAGGFGNSTAATWAYLDGPTSQPAPAVVATVDVNPDRLQVKDQGSGKGMLNAFVELPAGKSLADVVVGSVRLTVKGVALSPASLAPVAGDYDADGVPDLAFRFERSGVIEALGGSTGDVSVTVSGQLASGGTFSGVDAVTVVAHPKPGPKK